MSAQKENEAIIRAYYKTYIEGGCEPRTIEETATEIAKICPELRASVGKEMEGIWLKLLKHKVRLAIRGKYLRNKSGKLLRDKYGDKIREICYYEYKSNGKIETWNRPWLDILGDDTQFKLASEYIIKHSFHGHAELATFQYFDNKRVVELGKKSTTMSDLNAHEVFMKYFKRLTREYNKEVDPNKKVIRWRRKTIIKKMMEQR